jgi:hypothetical protein
VSKNLTGISGDSAGLSGNWPPACIARHNNRWHAICKSSGMSQGWQTMGTIKLIGEKEAVSKAPRPAMGRSRLAGWFFGRVRTVFALLFVLTLFVFAFSHSKELQNLIISKLYQWSQTELKSSTLRQDALQHESEVNRVAE